MRLGQLFRRSRLQADKNLREAAEALFEVIDNHVMLGQIERGVRPATSDQIQAFCDYIGVGTVAFFEAAQDYHRSVWEPQDHPLEVVDQVAKFASVGPVYDQHELVSALRSAISSMDIGADVLRKLYRVYCIASAHDSDVQLAKSVIPMLEAGAKFMRGVLERPIEPLSEGNPYAEAPGWTDVPKINKDPDWKDAERFEVGKVYEHRAGKLMRIVGEVETEGYGKTLVAEENGESNLIPVGIGEGHIDNYREVPLSRWYETWLEGNENSEELRKLLEQALLNEQDGPGGPP